MIVPLVKFAATGFGLVAVFGAAELASNVLDVPCRYEVQWHEEMGGYYEWFCDGNCKKTGTEAHCFEWSGVVSGTRYSWCDCEFALVAACDVWRKSNANWLCLNMGCSEDCDKPPDDGQRHFACLCP